jgi:hypothetical protein
MFFHILYIPLIPLQSQLVVDSGRGTIRVTALRRIRWRSVAAAYLRLVLVLGTLVSVLAALGYQSGADVATSLGHFAKTTGTEVFAGVALACIAAMIASYRIGRASPARAAELREVAGLARDVSGASEGGAR